MLLKATFLFFFWKEFYLATHERTTLKLDSNFANVRYQTMTELSVLSLALSDLHNTQ